MNKFKFLLYILFVSILIYQYPGCDSDTLNNFGGSSEIFGGYEINEAGVIMTLAALCYTADDNSNPIQVRDSLIIMLADTNYSTGGKWKLAWGPGMSPSGSSLVYAAVDTTSDTIKYAICVRGTVFNLANIIEDLDIIYMLKWPYSGTGDSVAYGSMQGFDTLLNTTDPVTQKSLQSFLDSLNAPKMKLFITGHSLGGAMATLIARWLVDIGFNSKFKIEAYTFAAPTVGNVSFANSYNTRLSGAGAESHRCTNSKDVVPYAWADLQKIIDNNIPTQVPALVNAAITTAKQYLQDSGIVYKHVETKRDLGSNDPVGCGPNGEYGTYVCWVEFEHSSQTYLRLLSADTINWNSR
ncbi:MAG TPA: hypothetical protein VJ455_10020 [Ignavibacteria bacterium]|nr:hypothetical protein [Ignavibacteria bacterium]